MTYGPKVLVAAFAMAACAESDPQSPDLQSPSLQSPSLQSGQPHAETSDSFTFSGLDPALTVAPTQVMVLGTAHLSRYSDELTLSDLDPLLDRLAGYDPDIITVESSSGLTCARARAFPREHEGYVDSYCLDGAPYRAESGLTQVDASYLARRSLLDWPDVPTPSQRRELAARFLAAEEADSALVQWLRLDASERVQGDELGPLSVEFLENRSRSMNESRSIAARLAARLGLERVFPADDHGSYIRREGEREVYAERLYALWPGEGDPCREHGEAADAKLTGGDVLGAYRDYNSDRYQRLQMDCDFRRTMNDDEPEGYGRQYTMGWEARNLRMAALIVSAATTEPGGRVLSIIGASHPLYVESYLDPLHDIEIVDPATVLE